MTEETCEEAEKTDQGFSPKLTCSFTRFIHNVIANDPRSIEGKINAEMDQVCVKNDVRAAADFPCNRAKFRIFFV